jgi:hypothetical protein
MRSGWAALGLLIASASAVSEAGAATITLFDRDTFQAAVVASAVNLQTFEGPADGTAFTNDGSVTYAASAGTPTVTDNFLTTTAPNSLGSSSTAAVSPPFFFLPTETATFTFLAPITAFAIDINTFATTDGAYTGTLNIGDVVPSVFDTFPNQQTGQFLGFISDTPFTSVTIAATTGLSYTLDTLVYGAAEDVVTPTPIPEAATVLLFGYGMATAAALRRFRKRN